MDSCGVVAVLCLFLIESIREYQVGLSPLQSHDEIYCRENKRLLAASKFLNQNCEFLSPVW